MTSERDKSPPNLSSAVSVATRSAKVKWDDGLRGTMNLSREQGQHADSTRTHLRWLRTSVLHQQEHEKERERGKSREERNLDPIRTPPSKRTDAKNCQALWLKGHRHSGPFLLSVGITRPQSERMLPCLQGVEVNKIRFQGHLASAKKIAYRDNWIEEIVVKYVRLKEANSSFLGKNQ